MASEATGSNQLASPGHSEFAKGIEKVRTEDLKVQFGLMEDEEMYYCPYQRSHQILKFKYPQHLLKCRRNYLRAVQSRTPVELVEICPYVPAVHHVPQRYFEDHLQLCPQKSKTEKLLNDMKNFQMMKSEDSPKLDAVASTSNGEEKTPPLAMTYNFARRPVRPHEDVQDSDSDSDEKEWVDDPAGGYDPRPKLEQNFYFRNPQGLTKSERKQFQISQVEKYPEYVRQAQAKELIEEDKKHVDKGVFYFENREKIKELGLEQYFLNNSSPSDASSSRKKE